MEVAAPVAVEMKKKMPDHDAQRYLSANVQIQQALPAALVHRHCSVDVEEINQERRKLMIVNATCRLALGTSMLAIGGDKHEFVPAHGQGRVGRVLENIDVVSTNINIANACQPKAKCMRQHEHTVRSHANMVADSMA